MNNLSNIIEIYVMCKKICGVLEEAYYNIIALSLMSDDWIYRNLNGDLQRLVFKTKSYLKEIRK